MTDPMHADYSEIESRLIPQAIGDALTFDMLYRPGKGFGQSVHGVEVQIIVLAWSPDVPSVRSVDRTFENEVSLH